MSKVMDIYVKFTRTTHQLWSCHVTLTSNSKNFYFSPNSVLNFRKNYQIWGNWLKNKKVTSKKQIGGGKHPPPSSYRVKSIIRRTLYIPQFFTILDSNIENLSV